MGKAAINGSTTAPPVWKLEPSGGDLVPRVVMGPGMTDGEYNSTIRQVRWHQIRVAGTGGGDKLVLD
jgi:hypothetical protein